MGTSLQAEGGVPAKAQRPVRDIILGNDGSFGRASVGIWEAGSKR